MATSMSSFEKYKPVLAMVVVHLIHATVVLTVKAAFTNGMNPMVFVVYRQTTSTLFMVPTTLLIKRRRLEEIGVGVKAFSLVFLSSIVLVFSKYLYYEGLQLTSAPMTTAMSNIVPVITFVITAASGLEKVELRSLRSIAKISGTVVCVGGAMFMTLFKGPKLLNLQNQNPILRPHSVAVSDGWTMGSLYLTAGFSLWSLYNILQAPIIRSYLDPLSLTTWICFLSTLQSAILTFVLYPNLRDWKIKSIIELFSCVLAGIFGSGVNAFIISWVISVKGPLFSTSFTPLNAVVATGFSVLILHQELYTGSLIGAIAVIGGLYMVLWGQTKDLETNSNPNPVEELPATDIAQNVKDDANIEEPLLA